MHFKHPENMVCRCKYHLIIFCQDHSLQNIYRLCQVCHLNPVGMMVEDIKMYRCRNGIPETVLLVQESRICSRFHFEPVAPFINHNSFCITWIISVHYSLMAFDYPIHFIIETEGLEPVFFAKVCCTVFITPSSGYGIIME